MTLDDLQDPAFLEYVRKLSGGKPITPDPKDFDQTVSTHTPKEQAEQYRKAQAKKLMRLCEQWRAGRN